MYEKGERIDSIINKLKFIDKEDLEKFINTRKDNKKKKEIKKDDTNTDNLSKILEIMKEMMNTMNILVSIEMKKNNLK
jgi:predicted transcriptional regulator YheO